MSNGKNLCTLEQKLGYSFENKGLLSEALTHSSYANELMQRNIPSRSNERLEFLGDSVLEIIASTYLFESYADVPEGELTKIRSEIICTDALCDYAKEIGLGDYLLLGNGERKYDGKNKPTTLENAFEALLGAIYLDSGCTLERVRDFAIPYISKRAKEAEIDSTDYKSELQQIIQQTPGETLSYEVTDRVGPDNAPTFTVAALLNSNVIGTGTGHSKRKAEQNAAKNALTRFFKKSY
ncbi:MAG: ribonuclease III [Clostridia bacterium]|nr:ribonuclease III [Clostridia bacterium]